MKKASGSRINVSNWCVSWYKMLENQVTVNQLLLVTTLFRDSLPIIKLRLLFATKLYPDPFWYKSYTTRTSPWGVNSKALCEVRQNSSHAKIDCLHYSYDSQSFIYIYIYDIKSIWIQKVLYQFIANVSNKLESL